MTHLTTHVLDASAGIAASGVAVVLADAEGALIDRGRTDAAGRISLGPERLRNGDYQLTFDTAGYFDSRGLPCFYPLVAVTFRVGGDDHYHVPLLLGPYSYSTYRGT